MNTHRIFRSLHDAKVDGFETYDRSRLVFIVRKKTADGWELAFVQMTLQPDPEHAPVEHEIV